MEHIDARTNRHGGVCSAAACRTYRPLAVKGAESMLSSYSIVRYVPDPIADERINIGVIVVGEGVMRTRFIEDWRRIQQFGAEDISFLHDFVHDLEKVTNTWQVESDDKQDWSIDTLTKLSAGWINSIQISTPRASLRTPDELLREIRDLAHI